MKISYFKMISRNLFKFFTSTNRITKAIVQSSNQFKFRNIRSLNHSIFRITIDKYNKNSTIFKPIALLSIVSVMAAQESDLLKQADELYDQNKFDEIEKLLNKPELIEQSDKKYEYKWRLARSRYGQVKEKQRDESELDAIRDLVLSSLQDNPQCGPAHKWASILIDEAAAKKGTKERIKQLLTVKSHMEKAIEFSPKDPTSLYLLAEWHYSCYNVSWAERQIAKVIFGTLPTPDLEEALKCLKKAEELEPGFYSKNLVLLAKTLIALKRETELAKESLHKVLSNYEQSTKWDDQEAIKEAKVLLKKL